jgi:hypothetical protein
MLMQDQQPLSNTSRGTAGESAATDSTAPALPISNLYVCHILPYISPVQKDVIPLAVLTSSSLLLQTHIRQALHPTCLLQHPYSVLRFLEADRLVVTVRQD